MSDNKYLPIMRKEVFDSLVDLLPDSDIEIEILRRFHNKEKSLLIQGYEGINPNLLWGLIKKSSTDKVIGSKDLAKFLYQPRNESNGEPIGTHGTYESSLDSSISLLSVHTRNIDLTPCNNIQLRFPVEYLTEFSTRAQNFKELVMNKKNNVKFQLYSQALYKSQL